MNLIEVDRRSCDKDGICAAVCPAGLIDFRKGAPPVPIAGAEQLCIRCGHCVAVCPTASLSHREIPTEHCPPVKKELRLTEAQCGQFFRARRSVRAYKEQSVPRYEVSKLIDLAGYAPTGHNSQGVEWLVLGNRGELKRLSGIVIDWMRWMTTNMPEIALSLNMDRSIRRWENGEDIVFRGAPVVIAAHASKDDRMARTSCTIALSHLELAAAGLGLGCCWAGYFHAAATSYPPMMESLPVPEGHQCMGAMMVGYPRFVYHRTPLRKPPRIEWRL